MKLSATKRNRPAPLLWLLFFVFVFAFCLIAIRPLSAASGDYNKPTTGTLAASEWNNLINDFVAKSGSRLDGNFSINTATSSTYALDINGALRATSVTGAFSGTLNAANVSTGLFGSNTGGGNYNFPARIGIGIGSTTPASTLTIANNGWISALNSAGTGQVNMFRVNANDELEVGGALNIGQFQFAEDSGFNTFVDMPVSAAPVAGTVEGYTMKVDGDNIFTVYSEANGSGGVQNKRIGIGTSTPAFTLDVAGIINASALYVAGAPYIGSQWTTQGSHIYYNTGNVGVGTSSPNSILHVFASSSSAYAKLDTNNPHAWLSFARDNVNYAYVGIGSAGYYGMPYTNALSFRSNAGYAFGNDAGTSWWMNINSSGNVGIGTTSPIAKLAVSNGAGNVINTGGGQINGLPAVQTEDSQAVSRKYLHDNFSSTSSVASSTAAALWFGTKNGNIWNGDAGAGNVGIGTTTPNNLIQVAGLINFDNTLTNTWLGYQSGKANTTGAENTALGNGALQSNSTGSYNVAIGKQALYQNNGSENLALGRMALYYNTSGSFNSAFGNTALGNITTGTHNIGFGKDAGRYITGGVVTNTTPTGSIYIGDYTRALADNGTNEIIIGYNLTGIGSNSLSIANTIYATGTNGANGGNVGVGTTNPALKFVVSNGTGNVINSAGGQINGLPAVQTEDSQAVSRRYLHDNFSSSSSASTTSLWSGTKNGNIWNGDAGVGNVGIGTTAPKSLLDIGSQFSGALSSNAFGSDIDFSIFQNAYTYSIASRTPGFKWNTSHGSFGSRGMRMSFYDGINFYADNAASTANTAFTPTSRMTITNTGNVGIGTTNPGVPLQVTGVIRAQNSGGRYLSLTPSTGNQEIGTSDGSLNLKPFNGIVQLYSSGDGVLDILNNNAGAIGVHIHSDGVSYFNGGNVGIGTTAPQRTLQVNAADIPLGGGAAVQYGGNLLIMSNDSAATDKGGSIGFGGNYSGTSPWTFASIKGARENVTSGTGYLAFFTESNGFHNERMRINSSGNVSIGTTTMASKLTVSNGTGNIISTLGGQIIGLPAVQTEDTQAVSRKYLHDNFSSSSSASTTSLWSGTKNGNIWNGDAGVGNVGIGTTNPMAMLTVVKATNGEALRLEVPSGQSQVYQSFRTWPGETTRLESYNDVSNGGSFRIYTLISNGALTEKMRITDIGNVGIGTTTPAQKLDVAGTINSGALGIPGKLLLNYSGDGNGGSILEMKSTLELSILKTRGRASEILMGNAYGYDFKSEGTSAMYITNSAVANPRYVGIGTTAPSEKLQVSGNAYITGAMGVGIAVQPNTTITASNNVGGGVSMYGLNYSGADNSTGVLGSSFVTGGTGIAYGIKGLVTNSTSRSGTNIAGYFSATGAGTTNYGLIVDLGNAGIGTTTPASKLVVSNGTGNVINSAGGQINGLPAVQTEDSQAVSRRYLHDNFATAASSTASSLWAGSLTGNISNANTGNVGIGTTAPSKKLEIQTSDGGARTTNEDALSLYRYAAGSPPYAGFGSGIVFKGRTYRNSAVQDHARIKTQLTGDSGADTGVDIIFENITNDSSTSTSEKMRIKNNGNIGIGTINPIYSVDVLNATSATPTYSRVGLDVTTSTSFPKLQFGSLGSYIGYDYSGNEAMVLNPRYINSVIKFQIAGTEKVRIDKDGNVGVGTTSSGAKLDVAGYTNGNGINIRSAGDVMIGTTTGASIFFDGNYNYAAGNYIRSLGTNIQGYYTAGVERMRINAAGSITISTTTVAAKLTVSNGTGNIISTLGGQIIGLPAVQTEDTQAVSRKYLHDNFSSSSTASTTSLWSGAKNGNIWNGDAGVGNVGIGTTAPAGKLQIIGAFDGAGVAPLIVQNTNAYSGDYLQYSQVWLNNAGSPMGWIRNDGSFYLNGQMKPNLVQMNVAGTAASPVIVQNWNTGLFFPATDGIAFSNAGVESMRIISGGNVGIGVTNPGKLLEISKSASGVVGPILNLVNPTSATGSAVEIRFAPAASYDVRYASIQGINRDGQNNMELAFVTGAGGAITEKMRINSTGNIGIGTTAPSQKLEIKGGALLITADEGTNRIRLRHNGDTSGGDISLYDSAGTFNTFISGDSGTNSYLNNGGNFGIGNTNPSVKLTMATSTGSIISTAGGQIIGLPAVQTEDTQAVSRKYLHDNFSSTSTSFWSGTKNGNIWNGDSGVGNVGIGTITPGSKLDVVGTGASSTPLTLIRAFNNIPYAAGNGLGAARIELGHGSGLHGYIEAGSYSETDSSAGYLAFGNRQPTNAITEAMRINNIGNVGINTTNPGAYRLNVNGNTNISGSLNVTGTTTATAFVGPLTGTMVAANVSSGAFGANTGGGNYSFPGVVSVLASSSSARLNLQNDAVSPGPAIVTRNTIGSTGSFLTQNITGGNQDSNVGSSALGWITSYVLEGSGSYGNYIAPNNFKGWQWMAFDGSVYASRFNISNAGNVGIGTTNPGTKLGINISDTGVTLGSSGSIIKLANTNSTANNIAAIDFPQDASGGGFSRIGVVYKSRTGGSEAQDMFFRTIGSGSSLEVMRLTSGGNVGIGTTDPGTYRLKVSGDVAITGSLQTQTGSDFAEEFSVVKDLPTGTVVVMDDNGHKSVRASSEAYDPKLIGVVSDNPSIIAGRVNSEHKVIVAMVGVVSVNVSNVNGRISKGDLLTSSMIEGYAMKAKDFKPGTIIGKALENLSTKEGKIKVLVNLQ